MRSAEQAYLLKINKRIDLTPFNDLRCHPCVAYVVVTTSHSATEKAGVGIAEQVSITNALRQSERRFRIATEAVNGILWTNDPRGEMQGEQPGWSQFTGQPREEYSGFGWSKAVHPEDAQPTIEAWQEAVREKRLFAFEHRVRLADGQYRLCSIRALPVLDDDGSVCEWVGVHTDITEDRQTREALADTDERLRLALTAAGGAGTWDWDVLRDRIYANEGFARLYGINPTQAAEGTGLDDFTRNIHPKDIARVSESIQRAMRSGEEYRLLQPDGSIRWVSAVGRCKRDGDGNSVRFPGVAIDISNVHLADDALRMSEETHRIAAEVSRLGHCRLDVATRTFVSTTPIYKANYGRKPEEEFTYADLLQSIHPEDRERVLQALETAVRDQSIYRADYRIHWPDGSLHWISASGRLIHFEDGTPPQMAGVALDATQKHLAETALLQAEKLAAVGRLASSIAHEINNPLESVTNLLFLARGSKTMNEAHRYLDTADEELRRVAIIANQTLRFHKQSTLPREVSCFALVSSVLAMYGGKLRNSAITVAQRERAQRQIRVYEGDIRQVLSNLLGNAIDAMPSGGRLLIRSRETYDWNTGRRGVMLTVADTGSGMSTQTQARIFEAFFTTKGVSGTGLGLWISCEIMERNGGRIFVRSSQREGHRGTVVCIFLPFDEGVTPLMLSSQ